jgi:GMP synthase (glutamine-hydrolysing)
VPPPNHERVVILDFGAQYAQLIARRVRELGVLSEVLPGTTPFAAVAALAPRGIILSGGPESVYAAGAPRPDPALWRSGVPILGICYGLQLLVHDLGGEVLPSDQREFGPAEIEALPESIFRGLAPRQQVWMSHGDRARALPPGFRVLARSANAPLAAIEDPARRLLGVQFHPEVAHTPAGTAMLRNFLLEICGCAGDWNMGDFLREQLDRIRETVGEERVVAGISGGVDSSVAALLIHRAIGEQLSCVFVDTGLLRWREGEQVMRDFRDRFQIPVRARHAAPEFLAALAGVSDPEEKRRRVGAVFIRVFEEEARALGEVHWLAQGTLYPDVIESRAALGPSHTIKTHHNVGGLPARMRLKLLEPLRLLFKDEVRALGVELGLDPTLAARHPFPGPGLAVRVLGEVTAERCELLRGADAVFMEELRAAGWYDRCAQAFAVLLPIRSVGVMGDTRTYESVVALRAVDSRDFMTADWSRLPPDLLARVSARIVNEVRGINRVVYDVTSKPPGTIEWE